MIEMTLDEFEKQAKNNPEGFMFKIICSKCESKECSLQGYDETGRGSELTGCWGDAGFIIKCRGCGNAYKVQSISM